MGGQLERRHWRRLRKHDDSPVVWVRALRPELWIERIGVRLVPGRRDRFERLRVDRDVLVERDPDIRPLDRALRKRRRAVTRSEEDPLAGVARARTGVEPGALGSARVAGREHPYAGMAVAVGHAIADRVRARRAQQRECCGSQRRRLPYENHLDPPFGDCTAASFSSGGRGSVEARHHCLYREGTRRSGREKRVSPSGLASWRSRSVNARIRSPASNARLRRPTVVCFRTRATTRRGIASFTACSLRSISAAALCTVTIGAPGSASISRSTAELARTRPSRLRQRRWISATRCSKLSASATARLIADANSSTQRLIASI